MMADRNPNLRVAPNPDSNGNETRDIIKTVALTTTVSTVVAVFAAAGARALYDAVRGAVKNGVKKPVAEAATPPPASAAAPNPYGPPPPPGGYYEDEMPEALRMNPRLRRTGPRKRRNTEESQTRIVDMFNDFNRKWDERFTRMESRIDELYEEEPEEDED
jgi:hypothetical protein